MKPGVMQEGSLLREYRLVVCPAGEAFNRIMEEKKDFSNQYGAFEKANPYITVAGFTVQEGMEDTIVRWLQKIFSREHSFTVSLNNYSGIPAHTIYLRVQDSTPFRHLIKQLEVLDDFIRSSSCPPVNLVKKPYLSIAGILPGNIYEKAISDYSRKTFHESFVVHELILLARRDPFDSFKTVQVFGLLPHGNDLFNKVA